MRKWISGSRIIEATENKDVQDPYSFRCIPQVMGASADVILQAEHVFQTENRSVSDNPLIFPKQDKIISGGNFHGQPLAIQLDALCIALSEMGSISERRIFRLLSGKRGLPPFLAENAGLHSGYMILQYTAASVASKNKQLCTPASADSLESSNGQEDHVSMGANAAVKCLQVFENTERIIAFELMTAARALEFRDKTGQSPALAGLLADFRKTLPHAAEDTYLHEDMEKALHHLKKISLEDLKIP
jgi:histidine ammonia-lyase